MRLLNLHSFILTMFLVAITACVSTPDEVPTPDEGPTSDEVPTSADGPTYLPGGDANEIDVRAFSEEELEEAVPGESGESPDGASAARDCVYVQWCNKRGPAGTICRLRKGCKYTEATVRECIADTKYVCGKPHYPWYLY